MNQLLSLSSDILLFCIAPNLCKWDQYQWLSTCKYHKPWLLQVRTIRISDRIPTVRDKMDRRVSMNVYWWDRFLNSDRQRLLHAVGCLDTTNTLRKLRLDINMNELIKHKALVLDLAPYLYHLLVDNSKQFENPTALAITRWLKISYQVYEIPSSETDFLQVIQKRIVEINTELEVPQVANKQVRSWNEVRGVNSVNIKHDKRYYIDLGANADETCLQSVSFHHCDTIVNVPDIPNVTLKYCKNIINFATSARIIHFVGMTIGDLSMFGNTKQLIVYACKVTRYPIPTTGKGQAWEFSNVDIVDVSGLQVLEKLTLRDCEYVKDGSMLGHVQTLTIEGGCMEHYPVPKTNKGQHWTLSKVDIADVSGLASLERLTLIECYQVTDVSMLGAVRYLTIEGCRNLISTEQYPKPVGRLQEWTFKKMNMQTVEMKLFDSLLHLSLVGCSFSDILQVSTAINVKCFEISTKNIKGKSNISFIGGKVVLEDKATLCSAVNLWCEHKAIAKSIYGDIQNWDVSNVKDMSLIFYYCKGFNDNISTWDVSNATTMSGMFSEASSFNQPLDAWDVSNVTNMSGMFSEASSFNQPLDAWDVSNVTDMSSMFREASSFNQPLDAWDVSNVTNLCWLERYPTRFK